MSVESRVETITPKKASEWLALNKTNRPLSPRHVNRLASAIVNGEWQLNGESIKFNDEYMIDGQHRLNAVIKSGKSIQSYVTRGLPEESYDTIDQGKSRSLGDVLARAGHKHYTQLAAAIRWVTVLQKQPESSEKLFGASSERTNKQLHDMLSSLPGLEGSVAFIRSSKDMEKVGFGGLLAALHWMFCQKSHEAADGFILRVMLGEGLRRDMPEYKLRAILLDQRGADKKLGHSLICTAIIKAWNSSRSGKPLKFLRVTSEDARPEIL